MFIIYWERSSQLKKKSFVFLCGEDDENGAIWLVESLLLFPLNTASGGTESGEVEEFAHAKSWRLQNLYEVFKRHLGLPFYGGSMGMSLFGF